jgi:hypothetical protein
MMHIEHILDDPANIFLRQLVWTTSSLPKAVAIQHRGWLEIQVMHNGSFSYHNAGMKKVVYRTADALGRWN